MPEGRILKVTYFSQNAPIGNVQSHTSDVVTKYKDDVHISWTEIRDFEIRATSEINYDYQNDSNMSNVTGEGIVFTGFIPRVSDMFLYMMRNGKIGIFVVSDIQRLALGQDTYHKINFVLQDFLTATQRDQFRRQTTNVLYFDKVKFVAGNNALLTQENYSIQKDLKHYRSEIIQNYMDRFYSYDFSSFVRPDGVYDPYVVEYWNKKVSFEENSTRPTQLLIAVNNYKKTIWSVLTNNPIKDLRNVSYDFDSFTYAATFWSVNITSLLGHTCLTIGDETASKLESTINYNNKAILMDTLPIFHSNKYDEALKKRSDKMFEAMRYNFYGPFLPHRKCAPHQHDVSAHFCEPHKCEYFFIDIHGHKVPIRKKKPPFPVVSNEELRDIWCVLHHKDPTKMTDTDEAKCRGYIEWYRRTYPGTLSRSELEREYRTYSNIDPEEILTDDEELGVLAYISEYRKQYLPVLTDREIEILWRITNRIPFNIELDVEQQGKLALMIGVYREEHGKVPNDGIDLPEVEVGKVITAEEVSAAGAVIYGDSVIVEPPSLTTLVEMLHETGKELIPSNPNAVQIEENNIVVNDLKIPLIFKPRFPPRNAHFHCHDICHRECGLHACNDIDKNTVVTPSYALSKEFYLGSAAMDPFESILYRTITNKEVHPREILEAICRYLEWDDEDAFYRLLFSIYLIDKAIFWLRYHS